MTTRVAEQESADLDFAAQNWFIKPGYRSRDRVEFYDDEDVNNGVVWQPQVYVLAEGLAQSVDADLIIDIGCGHAGKLVEIDRPRTVGVDIGANIDWCRAHYPNRLWVEHDLETDLPLDVGVGYRRAVVVCADVIEHVLDPSPLLRLLKSFADRGDSVLVSTPDRDRVRGVEDQGPPANPAHVREWNAGELRALLAAAGLQAHVGHTQERSDGPDRNTLLAVCRPGAAIETSTPTPMGQGRAEAPVVAAAASASAPPHNGEAAIWRERATQFQRDLETQRSRGRADTQRLTEALTQAARLEARCEGLLERLASAETSSASGSAMELELVRSEHRIELKDARIRELEVARDYLDASLQGLSSEFAHHRSEEARRSEALASRLAEFQSGHDAMEAGVEALMGPTRRVGDNRPSLDRLVEWVGGRDQISADLLEASAAALDEARSEAGPLRLEISRLSMQHAAAVAENLTLRDNVWRKDTRLSELETQLQRREDTVTELSTSLVQARADLEDLRQTEMAARGELDIQVKRLSMQHGAAVAENLVLRDNVWRKDNRLAELQGQAALAAELETLVADLSALAEVRAALLEQLEARLLEEQDSALASRNDLQAARDEASFAATAMRHEIEDREERLAALQAENERLQVSGAAAIAQAEFGRSAMESEAARLEDSLIRETTAREAEAASLRDDLSQARLLANERSEMLRAAESDLAALREEFGVAETDLAALREDYRALPWRAIGLHRSLRRFLPNALLRPLARLAPPDPQSRAHDET